MGMSVGGPGGGIKNEINITPLVDVVLVLLIIFMVITPMLQRGKAVELPQAAQSDDSTKDAHPLVLSVTSDRQLYLEQDPFDAPSLEKKLSQAFAVAPGRKVLLKGDRALTVGDVRRVMEMARKAGAKGVALGVEERKAAR